MRPNQNSIQNSRSSLAIAYAFANLAAATRAAARPAMLVVLAAMLAGCASRDTQSESSMSFEEFQNQYTSDQDIDGLNEQLLSMAVNTGESDSIYRLGAGDEVRIRVFGVEELSGEHRIDGSGRISLPLIGEVEVSGYTLAEAESVLAERYGESYLRDPQITISVLDYRSQKFTAVGAVAEPRVYNTERKVSLIEALAMAGGLSEKAGSTVYLTDRVRDPETGQLGTRSLAISVDDLTGGGSDVNLVLGESALINVPQAGSVFVEGAVERPGVYQQRGGTTVLKAIAMAGGLKFEADKSNLVVLRREPQSGEWVHQTVAFNDIRQSPNADIQLSDGDILVVENSALKSTWMGFWNGVARIAMLGFRPL